MQSHTEEIWNRFHERLLAFINGKVKNTPLAEDILQEVFIKIQVNLSKLQEEAKLESWIFQIARNAVNDHFRKNKKLEAAESAREQEEPEDQNTENLMPVVTGWLNEFIEELPEKYREAVILSELKGVPQHEMAKQLGISYSNARARVQRGRLLLKNNLEQCCEFFTDQYGNVIDYRSRKKPCSGC